MLLVAVFFLSLPVRAEPIVVDQVQIHVTSNSKDAENLKKLIPFTADQKTSTEEISKKMAEIRALNILKNVHYQLIPTAQNKTTLAIEMEEYQIIRDIKVHGNYPFLNKEILRLIPLQPSAVYNEADVTTSIQSINSFLRKNGFYNSHTEITSQPHRRHNTIDLHINLTKGATYRIDEITLTGNEKVSSRTLIGKLDRGSRFSRVRLNRNIKKIKKHYTEKGYIKARVKVEQIVLHTRTHKADLALSIRENKKAQIHFMGKLKFSRKRLKNVLNLSENRAYDTYSVRTAGQRLERFYHLNGYPDAIVGSSVQKTNDVVHITFKVHPSHKVQLVKIRFAGNRTFRKKTLKKNIISQESKLGNPSPFRATILQEDSKRLEDFYRNRGYLDTEVPLPEITSNKFNDQRTATFKINEGFVYKLKEVILSCDGPYDTKLLLKKSGLKVGKTITEESLNKAKINLYDELFSHGYAYAEIELKTETDATNHQVILKIIVHLDKQVHVRNIVIRGNDTTNENVIFENLKIKEGDLFVYQKVLDGQLNLRKLDTFQTVKIDTLGLSEKSNSIDLLIFVSALKTKLINLQAGFDNRNLAQGEFSFTKRNLFGYAKQFNTRVVGGQKFSRVEGTLYSPRIFGASWNLANQYFAQHEDAPNFNANSYGGFVSTLKNFGPYWTLGFKEAITRTNILEGQSDLALGDSLFDNTFNEGSLFLILDRRDNFSDPQKGYYILAQEELNTDLSDLGNNFNTINLNVSHFKKILPRITLTNTVRYGHSFKLTSQPRIPVNKLFFLGGADTLRGFEEDAVNRSGGTVMFVYNSELHARVFGNLKLAGFFDAGFLRDNINSISVSDFRESAGPGIRYFTPVGPIRVDYGFILDRRAGEPKSRLTFSFGYFF